MRMNVPVSKEMRSPMMNEEFWPAEFGWRRVSLRIVKAVMRTIVMSEFGQYKGDVTYLSRIWIMQSIQFEDVCMFVG